VKDEIPAQGWEALKKYEKHILGEGIVEYSEKYWSFCHNRAVTSAYIIETGIIWR